APALLRACLHAALLASAGDASLETRPSQAAVVQDPANQPPSMAPLPKASPARRFTITYRAHDGHARHAIVLFPHDYRAGDADPLPLIISPHGRGVDGAVNSRLWGDLPTIGRFAVINPDGEGRRLPLHSWGAPGQIHDL